MKNCPDFCKDKDFVILGQASSEFVTCGAHHLAELGAEHVKYADPAAHQHDEAYHCRVG